MIMCGQKSAERWMPLGWITPDPEGMDEPTLDCTLCGRDASLEIRLERLDDTANWRRVTSWRACDRHHDAYAVRADWLGPNDRVIYQHCG